jgi:aspartyl/asparaginyl beta-hydroxylase (cupin superfamily)
MNAALARRWPSTRTMCAPLAIFSKLTPGAWIRPPKGFLNTRLVHHLPLIVPPGCWFRVGAEFREWKKGKSFACNDTFNHEGRNTGVKGRTILVFNVWRPELTMDERRHVAALMESINAL